MGSALRVAAECLPGSCARSQHQPLVSMEEYHGVDSPQGSRGRNSPPERASIKRDMDEAIARLERIVTSRNEQIRICERLVLRHGKTPGQEARRWAVHHYRRLKRMTAQIEHHHHMLEMMQTLRSEMRLAEDMADAYSTFAKYSKQFDAVVGELRGYDVSELMSSLQENMEEMREMDSALVAGTSASALLGADDLAEYERELSALEEKYARSSLDEFLYSSSVADDAAAAERAGEREGQGQAQGEGESEGSSSNILGNLGNIVQLVTS